MTPAPHKHTPRPPSHASWPREEILISSVHLFLGTSRVNKSDEKKGSENKDVGAHLKSASAEGEISISFVWRIIFILRAWERANALITVEIVFIIDNSARDDTKQKKNLRFMKFNNFFASFVVLLKEKFHFHYGRREMEYLNKVVPSRMANLHTSRPIIESQLRISIASRD